MPTSSNVTGDTSGNILLKIRDGSTLQPVESQVQPDARAPTTTVTTSESQPANPLGRAAYEFRQEVLNAKKGDNEIDAFLAASAASSSKGLSEYQIDYLQ